MWLWEDQSICIRKCGQHFVLPHNLKQGTSSKIKGTSSETLTSGYTRDCYVYLGQLVPSLSKNQALWCGKQ